MYKTDFVCTYRYFETEPDGDITSDLFYKAQFLQLFGLIDYDERIINAGIELIVNKVNEIPELKMLVLKHPCNNELELDVLIRLLFSYHFMDVFHLCLIDAFHTGSVSETSKNKLLNAFDSFK